MDADPANRKREAHMAADEKMTVRQAEKEIENFKRCFMQYGCSRLKIQTISGSPAENIRIRAGTAISRRWSSIVRTA